MLGSLRKTTIASARKMPMSRKSLRLCACVSLFYFLRFLSSSPSPSYGYQDSPAFPQALSRRKSRALLCFWERKEDEEHFSELGKRIKRKKETAVGDGEIFCVSLNFSTKETKKKKTGSLSHSHTKKQAHVLLQGRCESDRVLSARAGGARGAGEEGTSR